MKKLIFLFLSLFIFTPFCFASDEYINELGVMMNKKELTNLKNLGFSQREIETMSEELFNANKDLEAELESTKTIYIKSDYTYKRKNNNIIPLSMTHTLKDDFIKNPDDYELVSVKNYEITEDEYDNYDDNGRDIYVTYDVNPDVHETSAKKLTTTISYISSSKYYRLKNELSWKTDPAMRSTDLYGIYGAESTQIPVSGSQYAGGTWTQVNSCDQSVTGSQTISKNYTSSGKWVKEAKGYGVAFALPKNTSETQPYDTLHGKPYPCPDYYLPNPPTIGSAVIAHAVKNMNFTFYYDVKKQNLGSTVNAFGSYQHAVKTVETSVDFSIDGSGLGGVFGLSAKLVEKYDQMQGTHAQILNPKW